jgi:hypothetical protein
MTKPTGRRTAGENARRAPTDNERLRRMAVAAARLQAYTCAWGRPIEQHHDEDDPRWKLTA